MDINALASQIKTWGLELGFDQVGICANDLSDAEHWLKRWLDLGRHGDMSYMQKHGERRTRPELLCPGTRSIISARMNYWPNTTDTIDDVLQQPTRAFISRYALGRDYHKVLRKRLTKLAQRLSAFIGDYGYRVFVDSAPVMEKAIAEKAGIGWIGKHTNLINEKIGSWFFLGEIYTDLELPVDEPAVEHCGTCQACIDCCPTQAIVAPYEVDARLCISYLTIELQGAIPEPLRPLIGNRIYGCDDCQAVCPWNKFARLTPEADFQARHQLDRVSLLEVFQWDQADFDRYTEGSAIRRIGYQRWLRNVAVALGNIDYHADIISLLLLRRDQTSDLVAEHINWAITQQNSNKLYNVK